MHEDGGKTSGGLLSQLVLCDSTLLLSFLFVPLRGAVFGGNGQTPWKLLFRAPGFPGDVRLDKVLEWFNARSTGLTLVDLFNHEP
jgi:hypothetical protein